MRPPEQITAVATMPSRELYRYWAFISYSHKDEAFAKRLQTYLETYRIPRPLVGRPVLGETVPPRLFPVFRDRDELPGASDLGAKLREHLKASRYLVVICSASSAHSRWVDEEIQHFRQLGRSDRVLCIVPDRQPNEAAAALSPDQYLPPSLRPDIDGDGQIDQEPIAADARAHADGWTNAMLKLVAGILSVEFDELRRREQRRVQLQRLQQATAMAVLLLFAATAYVFMADARAPIPGAGAIQRELDRHELTWYRPVHAASAVHDTAVRLRTTTVRELLGRWRRRAWNFPVIDTTAQSKTLLDVWLASQSATGALRAGGTEARESSAEMLKIFDLAFSPGVPIEVRGQQFGWRVGHYLPSGGQVIGSGTASGAGFWLVTGLAVALSRSDVIPAIDRAAYEAQLQRAQAITERYYGTGGGWNFFPNELEPEHHSTYASLLALLALLETRSAGMPWNGSVSNRDSRLLATANWLIDRFDESADPPGWRGAPTDSGAPVDGLTLQAYAELLRSEAEAGVKLPDVIVRAIDAHVTSLVDRPADYPIMNRTYFRPYRRADGLLIDGQESIYFAWHPWAIELCSWWIRRLERQHAPPEEIVVARRALGHLVVDLGEPIVSGMINGVAFPIAETSYTLASIESP